MIPGWPYSFVAALETGGTSSTALLDAIRLPPGADLAAVTVAQVRGVVQRLVAAGQWQQGDPEILVVLDAGYDAPRISCLLADLSVRVLGRMRSDRVLRRPTRLGPTTRWVDVSPSTAASSSSATRQHGAPRTCRPAPTPASTAPPPHKPGTACSSRPSAGPGHGCVHPRPPTAGPG
ncbi:transposase [Saccharothrix carnea]|uniref:transposase n=1 Tax=Saccharothrix carnea TaxID=1280637 RepID=UPI0024819F92|nr:transposase [Saccharothrix carnea]